MKNNINLNYWLDIEDISEAKKKIIVGEEFNKNTVRDVDYIVKTLHIEKIDNVLEFGCGIGRLIKPIASLCAGIVGVDVSDAMIHLAMNYCKKIPNIYLLPMPSETLINYKDNKIDKIYSLIVLQHIEKPKAFRILWELSRILKIGGKMLIQYPNIDQNGYFVYMIQKGQFSSAGYLLEFYTERELRMIFDFLHLTILKVDYVGTDFYVLAEKTKPHIEFPTLAYSPKK